MQTDTWYDLAVRDLCDLSKPVQEKLAEAEEIAMPTEADAEEEKEQGGLAA